MPGEREPVARGGFHCQLHLRHPRSNVRGGHPPSRSLPERLRQPGEHNDPDAKRILRRPGHVCMSRTFIPRQPECVSMKT